MDGVKTNFEMVGEFRKKFKLPVHQAKPTVTDDETFLFRYELCAEEMKELLQAHRKRDLIAVADALADLLYVTYGMAYEYGIPMDYVFAEVHRANMQKVRASSADDSLGKRASPLDVVKPEGFKPPNIRGILDGVISLNSP